MPSTLGGHTGAPGIADQTGLGHSEPPHRSSRPGSPGPLYSTPRQEGGL